MVAEPATALTPGLRVVTRPVPDPGDLLARLPAPSGVVWTRGGEGFIGWGEAVRVDLGPGERFARAAAALAALRREAEVDDPLGVPGSGLVAFTSFTFDPAASGSVLLVPATVLARRGGRAWLTTVDGAEAAVPPPQGLPATGRIRFAGASVSELAWLEAVDTARARLDGVTIEKVVLARDLAVWSEEPFDPRVLARRLAERFPACFTFAVDGLVGASPELLVRRTGTAVDSLVLAGSAARGRDAAEDAALGRTLLASSKDLHEHRPAVAAVAGALRALGVELQLDAEPRLLRLDNIQHLATDVRGRLAGAATALDLAGRLHPTPAVCGTPTDAARALIRELEGLDRGRYAGPVGWVDARGDGEFAIALRCAVVVGARARLFAGAGIVAESLPEAELEETRLKFRAMQSALEAR
jgi:menaquinone-specific isochorismate synthase